MADFPKPFGSVSYKRATDNSKQRFCFDINGVTFRLKINRVTQDQAVLQFVDGQGQMIPFPQGFTVVDNANQGALFLANQFVLVWLNTYQVRYQQEPVLIITNQRQQSIFGAARVQKGYTPLPLQQQAVAVAVIDADDAVLE